MQSPPLNDPYQHDVVPFVPTEWPEAPLRAPPRPAGSTNNRFANHRPSIVRRIIRAVASFLIAVLIGVGATLAWQYYGDAAKLTLITWEPSLGRLLSVSTTKSPPDSQAPAVAATSSEIIQRLEPMLDDLASVKRSLEQVTAKQEEMTQNIATLQAMEQEIRQKLASQPPSRAVPTPPRKPTPPAAQSSAVPSSSVPPPPPSTQQPLPLH